MSDRKYISIAFAILCPIFIAACSKKSPASFEPLNKGWSWTYEIVLRSSGLLSENRSTTFTITNGSARELNGKRVTPQQVEWNGTNSSLSTIIVFMVQDQTGIYEYARQRIGDSQPKVLTSPQYWLRYPIAVGMSWNDSYHAFTLGPNVSIPIRETVEAVDDVVSVPAGTFKNCVRVKALGSDGRFAMEGEKWLAPGIGLVKQISEEKEQVLLGRSGKVALQLQSFKH